MLIVRRARVPAALLPAPLPGAPVDPLEPAVLRDVAIDGTTIAAVAAPGDLGAAPLAREFDAGGALVFPGFVDAHVHLDKTHTWHRAPNRSGTFAGALQALADDKVHWTEADLHRRAGFALRCAWAHGTRVIRTHVDTSPQWGERSHAVMAELRREWAGRIKLQTVPLCGGGDYLSPEGENLADLALHHGASALGGFLQMSAALPAQLDRLLALAQERGVGIDLHVDESGNPQAECLRLVAEAVLRNRFTLPVVCGHCCSLAVQDPARAQATLALVREARIGVISLPECNLYLQDRRAAAAPFPRTPFWRGITLVHDLLDAGIPVACASDNVRDAFHAFGDYNPAEVYAQSVRLAHLDARLEDSVRVVTSAAADLIGEPLHGRIAPGAPAHLVVFDAHRFSELLSRPGAARTCIDAEEFHRAPPPDFGQLNDR
jgi:cytosine deaminase